jgi:hypothetical protein
MSELFRLFTWKELKSMVCGEESIDIQMLKNNTKYSGEFDLSTTSVSSSNGETKESKDQSTSSSSSTSKREQKQHPVVQWLWEILEESFDNIDRSNFLMFAWGRNRLPLDEKDFTMKMEIIGEKTKTTESLPASATCFFRVILSPW